MTGGIHLDSSRVKAFIEKEGYKMLSPYVCSKDKIKLQCPEGHIIFSPWADFRRGTRCRQCYDIRQSKPSIERFSKEVTKPNDSLTSSQLKDYEHIKDLESKAGVYEIVCLSNGKRYIGSTTSSRGFLFRWTRHIRDLNLETHHSQKLQRAWNKYGSNQFVFRVLEYTTPDQAIPREQYYLDLYKTYNTGYNIRNIAGDRRKALNKTTQELHKERVRRLEKIIKNLENSIVPLTQANLVEISGYSRKTVQKILKDLDIEVTKLTYKKNT